jgi:NADH:ubiquinone oxidoreductase subunit K
MLTQFLTFLLSIILFTTVLAMFILLRLPFIVMLLNIELLGFSAILNFINIVVLTDENIFFSMIVLGIMAIESVVGLGLFLYYNNNRNV